ncbi:hypothetical protein J2W28_001037 [Variovorax boronicumulans]|uniref:hypothetical protein n=1 Tax=Variovorax boronicumulans TaxID=436515 RepID=UPI00277E7B40|nr:hypothetical protein [Variovorax boronicumulans]MDP9992009.1 hypothetical protein [Variovorax boronicumulans]MDQ0001904.1 hypothetical protein [Variovorax boronicumulans]
MQNTGAQDKTAEQQLPGLEVREASPAEYLEAMNGRLKLDVRNVRGERVIPMNGTVPEDWKLV